MRNAYDTIIAILDYLPPLCRKSILDKIRRCNINAAFITEIRLRQGRRVSLSIGKKSVPCDHIMSSNDIKSTVRALCGGSVYAYQNTIMQGYIPMMCGGRAGVVGDVVDGSSSVAVESITALNIRVPHNVRGICSEVYDLFRRNGEGIIIYSSPSVGKTTLLRDLAIELSRGKEPMKVALIDSRRELDNGCIPTECLLDTYKGYPKSTGIEIAIRTMSSDVIICDEVGYEEIGAVRRAVLCSIPIIAAAHARSKDELCRRQGMDELIGSGAFGYCVGIERGEQSTTFSFDIERLGG